MIPSDLGPRLLCTMLLFFAMPEAQAYIDPGTGSLILQGLLAAFAAAAVLIRSYWYRIKAWLGLKKDPPPKPADGEQ